MAMMWMKVRSRSRPGMYYYFNRATQESTWKEPPRHLISEEAESVGKAVKPSSSSASTEATTPVSGQVPAAGRRPLLMQLQLNNNNSVNGGPRSGTQKNGRTQSSSSPTTPMATGAQSVPRLRSSSTSAASITEEAMECERWGTEEEVAMDVDVSEREQLQLISQIQSARDSILPSSSLESFGIPQDASPATFCEMLYIILDTNVLISHLQFLIELKDYAIKGVGRPILVVPWVVMQELDALKTRGNTGKKAKRVITFLYSCFSARHPRVRGETLEEVHTEVSNMGIANNDDKILHCCLLYQMKVKAYQGVVVLFSNDIQLCSKAMINDVKALNRKTLLTELRVMCRHASFTEPTSYTRTNEFSERVEQQMRTQQFRNIADDILREAESLGREGLAAAVKREMREAYKEDELWTTLVVVKPPWTLKDLVHLLDRHWVAVFMFVLNSPTRDVIHLLQNHVRRRSAMLPTFPDVRYFLTNILVVLQDFRRSSDCDGVLPYCISALQVLSQKLKEVEKETASQETPQPPTQRRPVPLQVAPPLPSPSTHTSPPAHTSPSTPSNPPPFPSAEALQLLANNVPIMAADQLQWILRVILETTKYCQTQLMETLQRPHSPAERNNASWYIKQLYELLNKIVTALNILVTSQLSIPRMQETLSSFDLFLQHIHQAGSPLTLDSFYHLLLSEDTIQLLQRAVQEYRLQLVGLEKFAQQYNLLNP